MTKTIVLIDDDPDDLEVLKTEISSFDSSYRCRCFNSPLQAIEALRIDFDCSPDFVFLDFNMPQMTGEECLIELRKGKLFPECIFTILSTAMPPDKIMHLKSIGADHAFAKPITSADFQTILLTIFSTSHTPVHIET